jgi:hypothetical protein
MKEEKRVFNFNLPDDLREYLRLKAENNKTTISQCIINLILDDKNKLEKENLLFNHVKNGFLNKLKEKKSETEMNQLIKEETEINQIIKDEIDSFKQELKLNLK